MEVTSSPTKERLISELIKGRDSTKKLQDLLRRKTDNDGSVSTQDLVMKILRSFSVSLLELSSCSSGELCPVPATTHADSVCSDNLEWDSGEGEKKAVRAVKDRRGCYKRRKTEDSRVKIVDTIEDGYVWRKYGQKEILNAIFPRCYYRCSYKNEGCKALKQVQQLEDGSEMFHITYFGFHTCHNMIRNVQMFSDSEALSFFLLNFDNSKLNNSPSSLSTITNAHIAPTMEQEDDSHAESDGNVAFSNHGQLSSPLLKDIIGNLEPSYEDIFKNGVSMDDLKFDESVFLQ